MGGQVQLIERTGEVPPNIVCQPHSDNLSEGHVRRGGWILCVEEGGRGGLVELMCRGRGGLVELVCRGRGGWVELVCT